ncbi:SH3 domain-containing protein [Helicobacter sp. MIT 11-5569]|uniref:SH3 domain-containing protein n=1 Tax=Helicobacter sp. MIT 11-5569 TaxID=1548151 RepID=UPI00051F8A5C|nr:SH3 domain-containing protein [Helicobacter sp. MIT 11-5569]TLD82899.1 SH3 domain-containing protein [Helicobacter sp. MIT 11-5569]
MLRFAVFCIGFGALVLIVESFLKPQEESKNLQNMQTQQEKPCFYVQASALNVRQSPNVQAKIVQTLPKDSKICLYFGVENGFLRVEKGYIATQYLSLSRAPQTEKIRVAKNSDYVQKATPKQERKILLTSTQKAPTQDNLRLARLAIHNQDYAKAKTLALKINQENPKNIESWEIFAKALYLEGNQSEAIVILQNFLLQNPNNSLVELLEQMRKGERI